MNGGIVVSEKDDGNVLEILGKDGVLRIAVWLGDKVKSVKRYEVFCPVCEYDNITLTYKLSFTSSKGHLTKGRLPCLCTERTKKLRRFNIDEFINKKFTTPRGGCLSVVTKDKSKVNNYFVTCSYCTSSYESQEVFKTPVSIVRRDLEQGNIPCGCSSRRDFILKRMGIDEFIGAKLFNGRITVVDSCHSNTDYYKIHCRVCSIDEELYPEIIASKSHLLQGKIPCGCSKSPRLDLRQKGILVNRRAISDMYKSSSLIERQGEIFVRLVCREGHFSDTVTYHSFINIGTGCPSCARTGYNQNKQGTLYISRWYGFGESFLKFGITNKPHEERCKQQARKSKLDYETVASFEGNGDVVFECERIVKKVLTTHICPKNWLPDGYTETVEDTPENLEKILKIVEECGLK
ncbi:endonuclease [Vibrio phage 5P1c]|nr:putative GIY-YIG nuclease family protein [Vibrio phage 495E54-1]CAH9011871.1 putative GIY-YIG nuclease family protein [Vibrio phage 496E54-1]